MPGRNGTGPTGYGPMTGGGRGWCGSESASVGRGMGAGRGAGMGRGGGRGWRNQYRASGLTGWERAAQAGPQATPGDAPDALAGLKEAFVEVLERLERLESAGQK
jgi:hypothetical protein